MKKTSPWFKKDSFNFRKVPTHTVKTIKVSSAWDYFKLEELKCKCGKCESTGLEMNIDLMHTLDIIRKELDFPLIINSAYRCEYWNEKVGGSKNSGHLTGEAIDIRICRSEAFIFLKKVFEFGSITGIGINQKDQHTSRFIHLDVKHNSAASKTSRPTIWSY